MKLHPHWHILLPSSTPGIYLEARVYLPIARQSAISSTSSANNPSLCTSTSSRAVRIDDVSPDVLQQMKSWGVKRLITAAHPWQKLGGNLLDPVISECLTASIYGDAQTGTALVTFNARGVGQSGGSMGIFGLYTVPGERDFAAVERYAVDLFEPEEIRRFGYSWGTIPALNAPPATPVQSILLVSPPSTLFALTSVFSSRSFKRALESFNDVTIIHGTKDQFTGVSAFESLARRGEVTCRVIDGADHFYRDAPSARQLVGEMRRWLEE